MKVILIACVILSVFAIDIQSNIFTNHEQQILAEIKDSHWANFILNYAEVHLQTQGYLQQLVESIQELLDDLNAELSDLIALFNRRTDNHNRDVSRLTQEIEDADRDIFNGSDLIDNVLFPQRDRISNTLRQLKSNIEANRKSLNEETLNRKKEHANFESRVAEHNSAIQAIDECLGLLSQLSNPSLVQIKRIQTQLGRLEMQFQNHDTFTPLVKALIALATEQNFSDQGVVQQIAKAFSDLRNNIVDSLNQETADENAQVAAFNDRVASLNNEHAEFQRSVLLRNAELTATNDKLQKTQEYLVQRKSDRDSLQAQLDAENDNYARETDIFQNLKSQYLREIDAASKAYGLLTQSSFENYVKSKLGF